METLTPRAETEANQMHFALDQAERYGQQMAWLELDNTNEWRIEIDIRHAWSTFINQFPKELQVYFREAFKSGYMQTWISVRFAQKLAALN